MRTCTLNRTALGSFNQSLRKGQVNNMSGIEFEPKTEETDLEIIEPGLDRSQLNLPEVLVDPPVKKSKIFRRRFCFSEGFRGRLDEIIMKLDDKVEPVEVLERTHDVVKIDCSRLSIDEMSMFEKEAFVLYYTDKSISKLIFEGNVAKFYGAFTKLC